MKRKRITVTMRDDLVKQVDQFIDDIMIRSRSQAMEYLLARVLTDFKLKKALVLAGGKAEEMGQLAKNIPKCMLKVKGKPILQHVIERLQSFNINDFIIYVDHLGERVIDFFEDGSSMGVNIEYLVEKKPKGRVYPMMLARKKLKDTFLLVYGDTICSLDIDDFLEFHRKNQSMATVALTSVSNPKNYGVINLKGNKITSFREKPMNHVESYLVSAGYYIFEPQIFNFLSRRMNTIEKDLFPSLASKGMLFGYPFQGLWLNINTPKDLKKARILV